MHATPDRRAAAAVLLEDFSLEMTGKDVAGLVAARGELPVGTRVNIAFLAQEDDSARLAAVRAVRDLDLVPVPHVAARRLTSGARLQEYLRALQAAGGSEQLLIVGGDPHNPLGPFEDSLAVIESGLLAPHGVRHVGITGYPEGHPDIPDAVLWDALRAKADALGRLGLEASVITQFGFDADAVLGWVEQVRSRGLDLPIRVGVPGPVGAKRLLGYAKRLGVATSAGAARKYGFSLTNLVSGTGPDRFVHALAAGYDETRHGPVKLHFFTFGGLPATTDWVRGFTATL